MNKETKEIDDSVFGSKVPLQIGDHVLLRLSKPDDGWLSSAGLLDDDCYVNTETDNFENCIWEIHVQNQYSAVREYKEAIVRDKAASEEMGLSNTSGNRASKHGKFYVNKDHMDQLYRAALNEQRLNERLMNLKIGKPVLFGDPIQLRHVKSKKFLTVSSHLLAKEERENMRISVTTDGDSLSCLDFLPRYRFDREGQVLTNNSEALIRVHERPGEYIHAAKSSEFGKLQSTPKSEVNCSLENSFWTVVIYQRAQDIKSNLVTAGQLVTFQDSDTLACVSTTKSLLQDKLNISFTKPLQMRDVIAGSTSHVGTNLLWLLEKAEVTSGGPILANIDRVTLRDLNTGKYLKVDTDVTDAVSKREEASLFVLNSTQSSTVHDRFVESNSTISLNADDVWLASSRNGSDTVVEGALENDRAISLTISTTLCQKLDAPLHYGVDAAAILKEMLNQSVQYQDNVVGIRELTTWLRTGANVLDSLSAFLSTADVLSGSEKLPKQVITCRQNMLREQGLLDVLLDILVMVGSGILKKVKNVLAKRDTYGASAKSTFKKAIKQLQMASYDKGDELDSKVDGAPKKKRRNSLQLFSGIMNEFRVQKNASTDSVETSLREGAGGGAPRNRKGSKARSSFARTSFVSGQQETIQAIARRLSASVQVDNVNGEDGEASDIEELDDAFSVARGTNNVNEPRNSDPNNAPGVEQQLVQKCLKALLHSITENRMNQSYVADRFPVLLSHVKLHRLAVLCVEEMLRENLHILQTKVRQREIDIFVSLLAESPMSVTFLQLIQSTCSCPMGVDATQRMVTYALFGFAEREHAKALAVRQNVKGRAVSQRILQQKKLADVSKGIIRMDQQLMVKLKADRNRTTPVTWGDFSLYCPLDPVHNILGYAELAQGLPELYLSWKVEGKYGELSMYNLFGYKDSVPLSAIFSNMGLLNRASRTGSVESSVTMNNMRRKASIYQPKSSTQNANTQQHKSQVAEYFVTQLYLVADLCLDRNYVAIGMLENLYEFDALVTMLKDTSIPSNVKAAVCRIIRCLYVDREPQVEGKYPRYIRTNVSLGGEIEHLSDKIAVHYEFYQFALLQQIISEHIHHELDFSSSDEYSAELMKLLQSLVGFGFYFGIPQMFDVLKPMIRVFDEHRIPALHHHQQHHHHHDNSSVTSGPTTVVKPVSFRASFDRVFAYWKEHKISPRETSHTVTSNVTAPANGSAKGSGDDDDDDHPQSSLFRFDDENEESSPIITQIFRRLLQFTESSNWTIIVLLATFLSIGFTITDMVINYSPPSFFIASVLFFIFELIFRFLVVLINNFFVWKFIRSPYNIIDVLLIAIDVVITYVDVEGFTFTNLRLIRILRLARVFKAARLIKKITKSSERKLWQSPMRYTTVTKNESKSIVTALQVLTMFYDRIQDKTLDITIKAFAHWCNETKNNKHCDAVDVFNKLIATEEKISSDLSIRYDQVLLDTIMYENREMTQEAVKLLMIHKSQKELFFQVCEKIQIIYSPRVESICKGLSDMLSELKRLSDMYEIWCDLESEDDQTTAQRALDILNRIRTYVAKKNEDRTLGIRTLTLVDEEVQNLLRNLDAMSAFMAVLKALFPQESAQPKETVFEIIRNCCDLICLFVRNSELNQQEAFKHIQWFVDRVDDNIGCSKIIRAMLEGNKTLIKRCPRKYLLEFAQKIVLKGHNPDYLDIFVGMSEFSNVVGSRVIAVESEIGTYLTAREWKKYILLWCDPNDNSSFRIRKEVMEKCAPLDLPEPSEDELTPDLRYHIRILMLLGTCNLGPKLHAIYSVQDVLQGLLDLSTIFPVKKALGNILIAQIKISIERVEKSESFWEFLQQIIGEIESLPDTMAKFFRSPNMRVQKGEWLELMLGVIIQFFELFDIEAFSELKLDKFSTINFIDIGGLVDRLYAALKILFDEHGGKLGLTLLEEVSFAMKVLKYQMDDEEFIDQEHLDENPGGNKLKLVRAQRKRSSIVFADVQQVFYRNQFKVFVGHLQAMNRGAGKVEILDFFHRVPRLKDKVESDIRFEPLIKKLASHFFSEVKRSSHSRTISDEVVDTCKWFLKSLRYVFEESLGISCDGLKDIDVVKFSDTPELTELRAIYNENGVVHLCMELIAVGIDHGLILEAVKLMIALLMCNGGSHQIQVTVNHFLVDHDSSLFFELVKEMLENLKSWSSNENELQINQTTMSIESSSIPEDIIVLQLLGLLCEGSYLAIRDYFRTQADNSKFVNIIETLASYLGILSKNENPDNNYVTTILLRTCLRFVQGPTRANQEQFVLHSELLISLNRTIRNIRPLLAQVRPTSAHKHLSHFHHSTQPHASTGFVITAAVVESLKESVVDLLRGIIEGQNKTSLVFDRVTSSIDFSVLQAIIFPEDDEEYLDNITAKKNLAPSQAKYLVLTQSMADSPGHRQEKALDDSMNRNTAVVKQEITSVEVLWHNEITVVYFHIPDSIKDLSAQSQHRVLENIQDYASRELKLMDFMKQCKQLYRQSKHQQFLKHYGLEGLWSLKHYLQRVMFLNAVVMNIFVVIYYGEEVHGEVYYGGMHRSLNTAESTEGYSFVTENSAAGASTETHEKGLLYEPDWVNRLLMLLIIIQTVAAIIILGIHSIVQLPVTFEAEREKTPSTLVALGRTLMDNMLVWYIGYVLFSLLALFVNHLFVSVLLLDWIVISPITQDLLLAIVYPAKQLIVTLVLILICINIFAGAIFVFYRQDGVTFTIRSMWDTVKLCISYGFRGEYGYDHEMLPTLGNRMVMDVIFFFVILSILREIFFAIIVDTFGTLRELKFERENEEKNSCFVCGIERHEYDLMTSSSGLSTTFSQHRAQAHNPINYLYFILNIWNQTPFDDSSLEMYVRQCLANNDVSWFPTGVLHEAHVVGIEDGEHKGGVSKSEHKGTVAEVISHGSSGNNLGGNESSSEIEKLHRNNRTRSSLLNCAEPESKSNTMQELLDKINAMNKQLNKLSRGNVVHHGHGHGNHGHGGHQTHHSPHAASGPAAVSTPTHIHVQGNANLAAVAPAPTNEPLISNGESNKNHYPTFTVGPVPGGVDPTTAGNVPSLQFLVPSTSTDGHAVVSSTSVISTSENMTERGDVTGRNGDSTGRDTPYELSQRQPSTPFLGTARSGNWGEHTMSGRFSRSLLPQESSSQFAEQMEVVTNTANRLDTTVTDILHRLEHVETALQSITHYCSAQEIAEKQDREFMRSSLQGIFALLKTKKQLPALKESSYGHHKKSNPTSRSSTPSRGNTGLGDMSGVLDASNLDVVEDISSIFGLEEDSNGRSSSSTSRGTIGMSQEPYFAGQQPPLQDDDRTMNSLDALSVSSSIANANSGKDLITVNTDVPSSVHRNSHGSVASTPSHASAKVPNKVSGPSLSLIGQFSKFS